MGISFLSKSTFYQIQESFLLPTIMSAWMAEAKRVVSLAKHVLSLLARKVVLSGDCRCSSPGYSAKYGTYTFMDTETDLIVDFEQVQCMETSRVATEKQGFSEH